MNTYIRDIESLPKRLSAMNLIKSRGEYSNGRNNKLNLETLEATSYGWWLYSTVRDGVLIFNNVFYSSATNKHQGNVKSVFDSLGIEIGFMVATRTDLKDLSKVAEEMELNMVSVCNLILKKGTRTTTNIDRWNGLFNSIDKLESLKGYFTATEKNQFSHSKTLKALLVSVSIKMEGL